MTSRERRENGTSEVLEQLSLCGVLGKQLCATICSIISHTFCSYIPDQILPGAEGVSLRVYLVCIALLTVP